jgi:hypothetical protein
MLRLTPTESQLLKKINSSPISLMKTDINQFVQKGPTIPASASVGATERAQNLITNIKQPNSLKNFVRSSGPNKKAVSNQTIEKKVELDKKGIDNAGVQNIKNNERQEVMAMASNTNYLDYVDDAFQFLNSQQGKQVIGLVGSIATKNPAYLGIGGTSTNTNVRYSANGRVMRRHKRIIPKAVTKWTTKALRRQKLVEKHARKFVKLAKIKHSSQKQSFSYTPYAYRPRTTYKRF